MPPLQHVMVFSASNSLADNNTDQDLDDRHQHTDDVNVLAFHIFLLYG